MRKVLLVVLMLCSIVYGTVTNLTDRVSAVGSATVGQAVPYTFPAGSTSDLIVKTRVITTGVEATLVLGTNYSATATSTGGTVTMITAVPATQEIHVIRNTPLTQTLVLTGTGAAAINAQFDKIAKQNIDDSARDKRSIRLPDTDPTIDMNLPNKFDRANKGLGFDSTGALTVDSFTIWQVDDTNASAYMKTLLQDTNSAAARATLEISTNSDLYKNIKDYGAVGDGATDDTSAINTALATGLPIYIPAGTYRLTSAIDIPDGTRLYGVGRPVNGVYGDVIFNIDHSGDGFVLYNANQSKIHLSGFMLSKNGLTDTGTGNGIKIYSDTDIAHISSGWQIDNVGITNFNNGVYVHAAVFGNMEKIAILKSTNAGIYMTGPTLLEGPHDCSFRDIWIHEAVYGIYLSGWQEMHTFDHVKLFSCSTRAIEADSTGGVRKNRITFSDTMFEYSGDVGATSLIKIVSGNGWTFQNLDVSETIPLFSSDSNTTNAGITVRNAVMSTGGIGIGNILLENVNPISKIATVPSNATDTLINHRYSEALIQSAYVTGGSVYGYNIISPAYQTGIGRTQYISAAGQALDNAYWTNAGITVATGQTDPYGGSNAYKITGTGSLENYGGVDYGASIQNKTFVFQVWAKPVSITDASVDIGISHTATDYKRRRFYLDRDEWTLCYAIIRPTVDDVNYFGLQIYNAATNTNGVYLYEPCFYEAEYPCAFQNAGDTYTAAVNFTREFGQQRKYQGEVLLSATTVALNANADTTLYTVPTGKRCVLTKAVVVAGADAGATTTLSIGQNTAETDFVPANTLSNLDAQYDAVVLSPIPNTTPLKNKSYAAGTVIQAQVANQSGGATNTVYLFGIFY